MERKAFPLAIMLTCSMLAVILLFACSRAYPITIDYVPGDGTVHEERVIKDVPRPIDTPAKACAVWSQAFSAYACRVTDGAQDQEVRDSAYWVLDNALICDKNVPYPCGGGCTGLMEKKTGNIKDLACTTLS